MCNQYVRHSFTYLAGGSSYLSVVVPGAATGAPNQQAMDFFTFFVQMMDILSFHYWWCDRFLIPTNSGSCNTAISDYATLNGEPTRIGQSSRNICRQMTQRCSRQTTGVRSLINCLGDVASPKQEARGLVYLVVDHQPEVFANCCIYRHMQELRMWVDTVNT